MEEGRATLREMKGQPDRDKRAAVSGVDKAQLNTSRAYGPSSFDPTTRPLPSRPRFSSRKGGEKPLSVTVKRKAD